MKIDRMSIFPIESIKASNRLNQTQKKTSASEADKVAFSDKKQVYQSLLQKIQELPAVREELVQAFAEQIERGEYQVDSRKIAEKLFSSIKRG